MHATLACTTCHGQLVFANIGSACADCHIDPHLGVLGFGCDDCHHTLSRDPRFGLTDFHDTTLFPLTGAHRALDCLACHGDTPPFDFALVPLECLGCHDDDRLSAVPDHVEAAFAVECELCHRTDAWVPTDILAAALDHDVFFPLRGAHSPLDCVDCHAEMFVGTSSECFICHEADYQAARDPDHVALGLPTDCERCHSSESWEGATEIDHDGFFPLNGVHAVLDCESCHAEAFAGTPRDCEPCHQADFSSADEPDHTALGLSLACEECHGESVWRVDAIDHDPFFALSGAHLGLACEACHFDGFNATSALCYSCHAQEYLAAASPNHLEAGFSTECEACHSSRAWVGAPFDHAFFPHAGGHAGLECTDCHFGQFAGRSSECVACHEAEFGSAEPDHLAAGFPLACELCHDIYSWDSAAIDHSSFPLEQGHGGLECLDCHTTDGFDDTPVDCFACHADDYAGARDPDHASAGFPTDCEECHFLNDWETVRFDHDTQYYPIYNGSHNGVWDTCATCHLDPGDFRFYECLLCHQHNQQDTDADHRGVEGYLYLSRACLDCHSIIGD